MFVGNLMVNILLDIDNGLNPRLCQVLCGLLEKNRKLQSVLTNFAFVRFACCKFIRRRRNVFCLDSSDW